MCQTQMFCHLFCFLLLVFSSVPIIADEDTELGEHGFAESGDVRVHCVAAGEAMLNCYKANYPREPYEIPQDDPPRVQCSVLMIHGLKDTALLPGALNDTWQWLEKDLTLVTLPEAGHFVQQDAAETVTSTMITWLTTSAAAR
ncbi:MAG: alpha/beta hydrolase [Fuerstiella sp.]